MQINFFFFNIPLGSIVSYILHPIQMTIRHKSEWNVTKGRPKNTLEDNSDERIIIRSFLPIGLLSEEASEARNKHYRCFRDKFSPQFVLDTQFWIIIYSKLFFDDLNFEKFNRF